MSISIEIEVKNIRKYIDLLKEEKELKIKLSNLNDEIINLMLCMDPEDINEAKKLYEEELKKDSWWEEEQ